MKFSQTPCWRASALKKSIESSCLKLHAIGEVLRTAPTTSPTSYHVLNISPTEISHSESTFLTDVKHRHDARPQRCNRMKSKHLPYVKVTSPLPAFPNGWTRLQDFRTSSRPILSRTPLSLATSWRNLSKRERNSMVARKLACVVGVERLRGDKKMPVLIALSAHTWSAAICAIVNNASKSMSQVTPFNRALNWGWCGWGGCGCGWEWVCGVWCVVCGVWVEERGGVGVVVGVRVGVGVGGGGGGGGCGCGCACGCGWRGGAQNRGAQDRSRHVCEVASDHEKSEDTTWADVVRTVLESSDSVLVRSDCCSLRRESVMCDALSKTSVSSKLFFLRESPRPLTTARASAVSLKVANWASDKNITSKGGHKRSMPRSCN